jgi:hypothetical protein
MKLFKEILNKTFLVLFITMVSVYIIVVGWMLFFPYNPVRADGIDIVDGNGKTLPPPYEYCRGEVVHFQFRGEKFMDATAHISIELINGERIEVSRYDSNNLPGKTFKIRSFIIPYTTPATTHGLWWTANYDVNALNTVKRQTHKDGIVIKDCSIGLQGIQGKRGLQGMQGKQGERGKGNNITIFGKQVNSK